MDEDDKFMFTVLGCVLLAIAFIVGIGMSLMKVFFGL